MSSVGERRCICSLLVVVGVGGWWRCGVNRDEARATEYILWDHQGRVMTFKYGEVVPSKPRAERIICGGHHGRLQEGGDKPE